LSASSVDLSSQVSATLGIATALGRSRTRRQADESRPGSVRPPSQTARATVPEGGDDPERADASAAARPCRCGASPSTAPTGASSQRPRGIAAYL